MSEVIALRQAQQKEKAIAYYAEIPIMKHAAAWAGVSEETLRLWQKDDAEFLDRLKEAKANFIKKHGKKARPEFMLERLAPEEFRETKRVELLNPLQAMVKRFELDNIIEGEIDDGQDGSDVQIAPPENT